MSTPIDDAFAAHEPPTDLWGKEVLSDHGNKIGTIAAVVNDPYTLEPAWAIVSLGAFRAKHVIPIDAGYQSDSGALVVPFERGAVAGAPKAPKDLVVTREIETAVRRHFGHAA